MNRLGLITATSTFLGNKASQAASLLGPGVFRDQNILGSFFTNVQKEMSQSILMPDNCEGDADALWKQLEKRYLECLDPETSHRLVDVYLTGLAQAKKDGRYFGRHQKELRERFNDDKMRAQQELKAFLTEHGFELKTEAEWRNMNLGNRSMGEYLLEYAYPIEAFVTKPSMINGESQNPSLETRPLSRA